MQKSNVLPLPDTYNFHVLWREDSPVWPYCGGHYVAAFF